MSAIALVGSVLGAARATISLLEEREKNYPKKQAAALKQRLDRIERDWYKEYNRDPSTRSDAVLDALMLELRILLDDITTGVRSPNLPH
jgi:hypothetical protein